MGVRVKNQKGYEWYAYGDHTLLKGEREESVDVVRAEAAVQASVDEVYAAFEDPDKWLATVGKDADQAGQKADEERNAKGNHFPWEHNSVSAFAPMTLVPGPVDTQRCQKQAKTVCVAKPYFPSNTCYSAKCAGASNCEAVKDGSTSCCKKAHGTYLCTDTKKLNPPPLFIDGRLAGKPGAVLFRAGPYLKGKGYQRYHGTYHLIDFAHDKERAMAQMQQALDESLVLTANPLRGKAKQMKVPSAAADSRLPSRPQESKSTKRSKWEKLIGDGNGNCKRESTWWPCGCESDPENPCKGKCICSTLVCQCQVAGYVGIDSVFKNSYSNNMNVPQTRRRRMGFRT